MFTVPGNYQSIWNEFQRFWPVLFSNLWFVKIEPFLLLSFLPGSNKISGLVLVSRKIKPQLPGKYVSEDSKQELSHFHFHFIY
jgi:hypothetical protein